MQLYPLDILTRVAVTKLQATLFFKCHNSSYYFYIRWRWKRTYEQCSIFELLAESIFT